MSVIGVVTEQSQESRVSATPETVKKLLALGYEVLVEKGAGAKAAFPDSAYKEAGA
ncbi:MAG TPA: NAD(P)(+) transhydrogenase (Re/Si-specific) subunit alpha, partial [Candidatus Aquiluna sp.]|nr:NAD(P)(+) transhydrogenase (Re/Si-specific) subunit alpha [Aquiluna sp.]